jgi:ABC-type nitrate/sulfonate/bicarbonate transport system substrate-binding protein
MGARGRAGARALGALAGLVLSIATAGPGQALAQPTELVVSVGGPADELAYLPVHAAAALGTFDAEGVRVILRRAKHPTGAASALREGDAAVAVTTLDQAIHGMWVRSLPAPILVAHTRAPALALLVAAGARDAVRGVGDLRGRVVAIPGPGTTGHLLLATLLRTGRIEPWRVNVRSVVGPALAGRLAAGDVDAAMTEEPWASRLVDAGRAAILVDFRRPEETVRLLGGPFYELVSVARGPRPAAPSGAPPAPAPPERPEPPEAALAAYARAVTRVQAWLATAPPEAVAARLPEGLLRDRTRLAAGLTALRATYAPDGLAAAAGLEATLRALRAGSPWPLTLRLGAAELAPPPGVAEALRALGPSPAAP